MVQNVEKQLKTAWKGWLSSIILSIFLLTFGIFVPMVIAHEAEKSRSGSGRFEPQNKRIWELDESSDLAPVSFRTDKWPYPWDLSLTSNVNAYDQTGVESPVFWWYHTKVGTLYYNHVNPIDYNIIDVERNGTVNEYLVTSLVADGTKSSVPAPHELTYNIQHDYERLWFVLDISSDDLVKNDANRMDIYIDLDSFVEMDITVYFTSPKGFYQLDNGIIKDDELYSIDIDTMDLIQIAGLKDDDEIVTVVIRAPDQPDTFDDGDLIVFDAQVYGVITKTATLDRIGVWYMLYAGMLVFVLIGMSPWVSFDDMVKEFRKLVRQ